MRTTLLLIILVGSMLGSEADAQLHFRAITTDYSKYPLVQVYGGLRNEACKFSFPKGIADRLVVTDLKSDSDVPFVVRPFDPTPIPHSVAIVIDADDSAMSYAGPRIKNAAKRIIRILNLADSDEFVVLVNKHSGLSYIHGDNKTWLGVHDTAAVFADIDSVRPDGMADVTKPFFGDSNSVITSSGYPGAILEAPIRASPHHNTNFIMIVVSGGNDVIDNDGVFGDNGYYSYVRTVLEHVRNKMPNGPPAIKSYNVVYHGYDPNVNPNDNRRRVNWYRYNTLTSFFDVDTAVGPSGIEAFDDSMLTILQLQTWQTRFGVVQFTPSAATLAMNLDTMHFEIRNDSLEFKDTISIINWPQLDAPTSAPTSSQLRIVEHDHNIMIESPTDEPIRIFDALGRMVTHGRTNERLNSRLSAGCYFVQLLDSGESVNVMVR